MHYEVSCAIFKEVIIAKGLTRFWVEIIIYTCKPAIMVNMDALRAMLIIANISHR